MAAKVPPKYENAPNALFHYVQENPHLLPLPPGEGWGEGELQERHIVKPYPSREILSHCSALRTGQTNPERKLWSRVRHRQLGGLKFRRQHPIGPYILDFYCHEAKLAVELDGSGHQEPEQAEYDDNRSVELQSMGIRVVRFWNNDVMENIEDVMESIRDALTPTLSQGERES